MWEGGGGGVNPMLFSCNYVLIDHLGSETTGHLVGQTLVLIKLRNHIFIYETKDHYMSLKKQK